MFFVLAVLAPVIGGASLPTEARVEAARAVERARYAFVLSATSPFDDAYPRQVFEKRVTREIKEERVLAARFGVAIQPELLSKEYERIEASTRAPEEWAAVKKALGNDRRLIEDALCRPLLVDRLLRARFAFDAEIHAEAHGRAREARARLLAGLQVRGATVVRLSRGKDAAESTEALLERAQGRATGPQVRNPERELHGPLALDPEALRVLSPQLAKPGDVSTILSERDRFSVYRLIESNAEFWTVDAVVHPKLDFDTWLAKE